MYSVILCGGSGTRLWPLSRKNFPKQFLNLYSDKSLLQETFLRMSEVMPKENIFFSTNNDHFFNVFNQIKEVYPGFKKENILIEPKSLNTAPAILLAVKHLKENIGVSRKDLIFFLPADHFISDKKAYQTLFEKIKNKIKDEVGIIGIVPKKPETGYGYIKKGEKKEGYFKVSEFKEKPSLEVAEKYLESGDYLQNSGIYFFNTETFQKELKKYAPKMYEFFGKNFEDFIKDFKELPAISIDCAISEKSNNIIVFEGDFGWNDIGSFDSLAGALFETKEYNKKHIGINSKNIFTHSTGDYLVVTSGVEDLIIVENNDSILVQKKGKSEDVKKITDFLKEKKHKEIEHNIVVHRPWGKYEILIDSPTYKVKKITVYPGAKLSLQSHQHRAEHWVVVSGVAGVVNGDREFQLKENESTYVPALNRHRLSNLGKVNLEMIEVQTGDYLEEDDIVRYDDIYNRIKE